MRDNVIDRQIDGPSVHFNDLAGGTQRSVVSFDENRFRKTQACDDPVEG